MWELTLGTVANIASTSPPTRSASASPAPLYATIVTSIPASILSSSISRRAGDPGPTLAKLIAPGLDLASFTSSGTVSGPRPGWTIKTSGPRTSSEIGEGVVGKIPEEVGVGGVAVEHREQRVAVRRGLDRRRRAEGSSRPRAVFDEKLLAERLGELRGDQARADVGETAGCVRDDDSHGLAGIRLTERLRETGRC